MKITIFKDVSKFLQKDISLSLSISYIVLIAIGMIFNVSYYFRFQINIIEYSDISDFLLAPFRDPFILIFTIGTLIFVYFFTIYNEWAEREYPNYYKWMHIAMRFKVFKNWYYSRNGSIILMLIYIFAAADTYGKNKSKSILNGSSHNTHITLKDNKLEPTDTLFFIGKTNGYTLLFNKSKKSTLVIPMSDVLRIEVAE